MAYNDILSLDVGGTRFKTTRQTLLKDPESMLARMFDPDSQIPPAQIQDGAYFLDRDPSMFNMILKFLRSGHLVENISSEVLVELQVEAEYYQLTSLLEIIKQRLGVKEDNNSNLKDEVNVIYEGQTYKCKPDALQYCDKEQIDENGDFNARDIYFCICRLKQRNNGNRQRNECDCGNRYHAPTPEDLVRRILRRLEENRVSHVEPPLRTELCEDSLAARRMGLLPSDWSKWFC